MLPSTCCTEAIASTVAATSSRRMMPATSGTSYRRTWPPTVPGHRGFDFLDVDHDALAENRVQGVLEGVHPTRVVFDHPAQKLVVLPHRRGVGVHAVRALQPP